MPAWVHNVPDTVPVVLTSPDGRLAHFAAAELKSAKPDLDVRVLDGGTAAWAAAGSTLEAGMDGRAMTTTDDIWAKPYENEGRVREAMEAYLTWEVGLVDQVERDGLVQFRKFA